MTTTQTLMVCGTALIVAGMIVNALETRRAASSRRDARTQRDTVELAVVGALLSVDVDEVQAKRIAALVASELEAGSVFDGHGWRELYR